MYVGSLLRSHHQIPLEIIYLRTAHVPHLLPPYQAFTKFNVNNAQVATAPILVKQALTYQIG